MLLEFRKLIKLFFLIHIFFIICFCIIAYNIYKIIKHTFSGSNDESGVPCRGAGETPGGGTQYR